MEVIIMRGIPGSGKSTWIKKFYSDAKVFSADHYFTGEDGVYRFDPTKLGEAHNQCLRDYIRFLDRAKEEDGIVIVDNTNLKVFEIAPYYRIAEALDIRVSICYMVCDPITASQRNIHNVPREKVFQMYNSIEPLPPWWVPSFATAK